MNPRRRPRRPLLAGLALLVVALAGLGACSTGEKSFTITRIDTEAVLNPDGSMDVVERATYDFTGNFSVGTRSFESAGFDYEIVDVRAFEDGEPLPTITDTPSLFEWDLDPDADSSTSGTHTYELRYRVTDAALVHPDVAELYWNWIGTTSPGTDRLDVDLQVPGPGRQVRAWAHGPLNGEISREGDHILLAVTDVPPGQFVDSRVLVPADRFTVEPFGPPVEDRIVAEETRLAEIANEQRAAAAEQADRDRQVRAFFTVVTPLLIALGWLVFLLVWRRWGKEPPAPPDIGDYWREVPDDPPAVAVALLNWGTVTSTAFAATTVDLAQRGFLTITETAGSGGLFGSKTEYRFDWQGQDSSGLLPFERDLLGTLFQGGQSITQTEFTAWARAHQSASAKFWSRFQKQVTAEFNTRGYVARNRPAPYLIHTAVMSVLGIMGFLSFAADAPVVAGAALFSAVALLFCTGLLRQRTPAGSERYAQWTGLKRFLADFSRLDEAVSGDLVIYERYLVASVALGVADQLVAGLQAKLPTEVDQQQFATWYVGHSAATMGRGFGSMGSIGTFASNFGSKATSSFTPPSSSSSGSGFSGGGFSSGGGGGGGGGGFGAR
ncbi:MAG: DUF2207 domain-containing protein [Acidimicrobiales bacterium]|nr:DUF2207 domain-containing protein [Acidimicrobiales bacterium]MCB9371939.1 DUF2207 domain-containing protein [Microthrixaceae bacterium]